jgi:hypothetical protein
MQYERAAALPLLLLPPPLPPPVLLGTLPAAGTEKQRHLSNGRAAGMRQQRRDAMAMATFIPRCGAAARVAILLT